MRWSSGPRSGTRRTNRLFWSLISNMSLFESNMLLGCELHTPKVYKYAHGTKSVVHANAGDILWPVEFLLCCYSRKHILHGDRLPSVASVGHSLQQWANKLRWRLCYWNLACDDARRTLRTTRRTTPYCNVQA